MLDFARALSRAQVLAPSAPASPGPRSGEGEKAAESEHETEAHKLQRADGGRRSVPKTLLHGRDGEAVLRVGDYIVRN